VRSFCCGGSNDEICEATEAAATATATAATTTTDVMSTLIQARIGLTLVRAMVR
jgi:hypothetical protein